MALTMTSLFLVLCLLAASCKTQDVPTLPRFLGELPFLHPAYVEIYEDEEKTQEPTDRLTLYVSTFDPTAYFKEDPVYYLRAPGRFLDDVANWQLVELDRSAFWPNNPDYLPSSVVGFEGVVWTSGFLVPSKTKGKLQLYNRQDLAAKPINIASADPRDFSYHRVIWKDMDGDGDLDALTARFHNADQEQQLLWMENPGSAVEGWTQHVLATMGADVHFRTVEIQSNGITYDCVLAGEFWQEQVKIYFIDKSAPGGWTEPSNIQSVLIDGTCGQVFDVYIDDFNRDGKIEFLATTYDTNIKVGSVNVYQIPDTFPDGEWTKITIADGFEPNFILGGQSMSPGTPKPFYPSVAYENEVQPDGRQRKPWLAVSGDDDGRVYVIRPLSEDPNDWTYEKKVLVDTMETTSGKMAIADLDGDGYREIVAAGYSANMLYVFTYAP